MNVLAICSRLLLTMLMLSVLVDLSTLLGERVAALTTPATPVAVSPALQTRRAMMDRLADARSISSADPLRAEQALLGVFAHAIDPQVRSAAALQLLSLAINDWPRGHQQSFLASVLPAALESGRQHKLPPSIILSQAILESGWGRSRLATEHNNLFGIKAGAEQAGVDYPTLEASAAGVQVVRQRFRSYASPAMSIEGHGALLSRDRRYSAARAHRGNWRPFLTELAPVYASDPHYARRITEIITRYKLDRWDAIVGGDTEGMLASGITRETPARSPRG
jgi:flagellum-specific peptidoglycan hydrolase FlgJ